MKSTVLLLAAAMLGVAPAEDGARYLIVTADSYYSSVQPLAQWKQASGMMCKVVRMSQIGSDTTSLKNYIRTAYATWPIRPEYVLIVGSASSVPSRQYYSHGSVYVSTDNIYGDMSGDLLAEIPVGRLPATTTTMLDAMIAKTLDYEMHPDMTDSLWMRRMTTIVREGSDTDDSVYWNNVRRACQQAAGAGFVSADSLSSLRGDDAGDVIASVNRGTGLVLYRGTATGSWYEPFVVRPSQVTATHKLPIILSITCATMTLVPGEQMLGDSWIRTGTDSNPCGAVAFFGNTHSASDVAAVRGAICRGWFDGVFDEHIFKLGAACLRAKQQLYQEYPDKTSDYRGFNLLGDPDLNIWTATPHLPNVSHLRTIRPGSQQFDVAVTNGLTPVVGALVCVSMDSTVYEYGYTDVKGTIALNINPLDTGAMRIVVTGNNLHPYDADVAVALTVIADASDLGPRGALLVDPTVSVSGAHIRCSIPRTSSLAICSASGRVKSEFDVTGKPLFWNGCDERGRRCEPGVYLCLATDASGRILASTKLLLVR